MHKTIDILLIDDCDADSNRTRAAVRRAAPSASLVRVKDGEQALRLMFQQGLYTTAPHIPLLVLLELNVPRTDGCGVLRRLRNETNGARIPVIVLTSCSDQRVIDASYALGARECLVKPSDADEYSSEVECVVQQHLGWQVAARVG